jgi:hypothetical protein
MKNYFFTFFFLALFSCTHKNSPQPIWLNQNSSDCYTSDTFLFKSNTKNWQTYLYTFAQPIPLHVDEHNDTLKINMDTTNGIIEGPAQICLQREEETIFYPIFIKNKINTSVITRDYRSPKTVNPDSSLIQQSIKLQFDLNRNIQVNKNDEYFFEEKITIAPIVKTSRALANEPITANYLQAGTVTNIPLHASYNNNLKQYIITAGPMYDAYKNIISEGTNVVFEFTSNTHKGLLNATTINGLATVFLPITNNDNYSVMARINTITSTKINIAN